MNASSEDPENFTALNAKMFLHSKFAVFAEEMCRCAAGHQMHSFTWIFNFFFFLRSWAVDEAAAPLLRVR